MNTGTCAECDRPASTKGLCTLHYQRSRREPAVPRVQRGWLSPAGYRIVRRRGHPNAAPDGQIAEHRWVMAEHIGRPLYPDETVHHVNGDRQDNRMENLELWVSRHGPGQRVEDRITDAIALLRRYAPSELANAEG